MDTFSYRIFLTIAKYQSFQKAAELYHVTPPAISHTIRELEKEFGSPLFTRSKRGVSLTSFGSTVFPVIADIVYKEDSLHQLVSELHGLTKGHMHNLNTGVKMLRITPHENRIIGITVRDEKNLAPAAGKFLSFVREYQFK